MKELVIWNKVVGVIWALLSIPVGFVVLVGMNFCTAPSPSECSHNPLDILLWVVPVVFIVGAIAGIRAKQTDSFLITILVLLPFIPILLFFNPGILYNLGI
jgi:hypothetical protein